MTRAQILSLPKPLRIAAQIVRPTGLHRPHAAIVGQQFVNCPPCGVETAAVVHADGSHTCTEGHTSGGPK